jgi:hypothetical protein
MGVVRAQLADARAFRGWPKYDAASALARGLRGDALAAADRELERLRRSDAGRSYPGAQNGARAGWPSRGRRHRPRAPAR